MDKNQLHEKLARIIVAKLRDENYNAYLELRNYSRSPGAETPGQNSTIVPALSEIELERVKFLQSLSEEQIRLLDKLVLQNLDNVAFNFLREVEENKGSARGVGLTIDSVPSENIDQSLLSGTLFGEYFLWVERFSQYGPFQH